MDVRLDCECGEIAWIGREDYVAVARQQDHGGVDHIPPTGLPEQTASVTWTANWTGNDGTGPQSGTASLSRSTTINVPVVEVQTPNR